MCKGNKYLSWNISKAMHVLENDIKQKKLKLFDIADATKSEVLLLWILSLSLPHPFFLSCLFSLFHILLLSLSLSFILSLSAFFFSFSHFHSLLLFLAFSISLTFSLKSIFRLSHSQSSSHFLSPFPLLLQITLFILICLHNFDH